jgi:hypothetical protein
VKGEQGSDGIDVEPQLPGATDERKPAQVKGAVQPPVVLRARRLREEAYLLVITDRWHPHPASGGSNPNWHILPGHKA